MKGIWALIKFVGKFVQGLGSFTIGVIVLLGLFGIMVATNSKQSNIPAIEDGSVLILWPQGNIVELTQLQDPLATLFPQYSNQIVETSIHDITTALKRAKADKRIAAMALITDSLAGAAPSHLHTIAAAIRDFKSSGKKVYALSSSYTQADYMLAAEADKIYMNPYGSIMMTGYGSYPTYFKGLLEKIGATVNVFRVGTYKAAVEPFIRDDMSDAAKEANLAYLSSLWDQYTGSIETARGLNTGSLNTSINSMAENLRAAEGDFGTLALNTGLVDELSPRQTWRKALIDEYGLDATGVSFKQVHFQNYLAATNRYTAKPNKIAVITAQGNIVMGEGPVNVAAAETLIGYIREARNTPETAAIVLRVDSPGGSAFASELIRQELVAAQDQGIKVIASMGPVAASGGYWISATSDEIWADPSTITGSIGIFGLVPTFENTLDKLGVHTDGVGTTALAGAFDVTRPMSDMSKDIIQQNIEAGYARFINLVSKGRGMPPEAVDRIAQGRVWSGETALQLGLVDQLGGFDDAVAAAAKAANVEDYEVVFYRDRPNEFEQAIADLLNSSIGMDAVKPLFSGSQNPVMQTAMEVKKGIDVLNNLNDPAGSYIVCLVCDVRVK
ncbi:signal peptide peptidase SppA [Kordiimonas pumila]|uniref:Signal peptide peptidase SppA n=1 Tax=Kordiimonas pumila TaxID=2161677 RepID=A0ABV7D914_9PROT|nr:signal peptide peptidase SppA [Kordiimonas pumila]